jgi:hypothetical protein
VKPKARCKQSCLFSPSHMSEHVVGGWEEEPGHVAPWGGCSRQREVSAKALGWSCPAGLTAVSTQSSSLRVGLSSCSGQKGPAGLGSSPLSWWAKLFGYCPQGAPSSPSGSSWGQEGPRNGGVQEGEDGQQVLLLTALTGCQSPLKSTAHLCSSVGRQMGPG